MKTHILSTALGILMLVTSGCSLKQSEVSMVAATDKSSVIVEAEFSPETSDSTQVIRITCNRSWSAHLNDFDSPIDESDPTQMIEWAYLSEESHPNLTHVTEVTDLIITFRRNYTQLPKNGVVHIYVEGGYVLAVNLTQKGAIYRLYPSVASTTASDEGELIPIKIDCNTNWKVRIKEGATAEAVLKTTEGFDDATINLRIKENEDKIEKTVSLIFSATDCRDTTITFTQAASSSTLKTFEVFTKMEINGESPYQKPILKMDEEKIKETIKDTPAKYYYTCNTTGFDDLEIPTIQSPEFPTEGIQIMSEQERADNFLYVIVMGRCEGYRNSYTRILVRDWHFGKKYIYESMYGLTIDMDPDEVADNYIRYKLDKVRTTAKLSTTTSFTGNGYVFYKVHNQTQTAYKDHQFVIRVADEIVDSKSFTSEQFVWNNPGCFISPQFTFEQNDAVAAEIYTWGLGIWDLCFLEQQKYKP